MMTLERDEFEDGRCLTCGSTFEMHLEFPYGIRYIEPKKIESIFCNNYDDPIGDLFDDIKTCYKYVDTPI